MPEISRHGVLAGMGAGLGNILIFNHFLPSLADVQGVDPYNVDIESAERKALFVCTAWTLLLTFITQKAETFIIGGAVLVGEDFAFKHANAINPATGSTQSPGGQEMTLSPLPDYTEGTG